MNENDRLLKTIEAAQFLQLPRGTLLRYTHLRIIPFYKIGRYNFFKQSDLEAFIEARRLEPVTK